MLIYIILKMPKSKRDKKSNWIFFIIISQLLILCINSVPKFSVSLTQTTKKGVDLKQNIIEKVRNAVEEYDHIFVFHTNNVRNGKLKNVRMQWRDSKYDIVHL